ncbi:MAG: TolC family protein [Vicinamibacterales bacterium]
MKHLPVARTSVLFAAALVAGASMAFAQAAPAQSEQSRLAEIARVAAQQFEISRANVDAGQTRPGVATPDVGAEVGLSLDDATARALERNLELAVERLNPQTFDLNIARLEAAYRPTLTSLFGKNSRLQPPTSTLNGGFIVDNDQTIYNTGVTQALKWTGTDVTFAFNNNRQVTNNRNANFNPAYNNSFALTAVQPLLRGFRIDGTRQQLAVTAINRDISEVQLRGTIATTMSAVRNAYWELLYAIEAVGVARGSLELAEKLVDDNRARVEVGTMAPLDVVQAEAEAATRRQALAQAEATWRTAELALKRLIVNGTEDPLWRASINPTDRPAFEPIALDVEGAVRKALEERTDLAQGRRTIEANDITLRFMRNQTLPLLDLQAQYGAAGLGGTQFQRSGGGGITSEIIGTIPGGYADAFRNLRNLDYPNWNFQLNLSYPLGGSAAQASLARARVQRNQSAAQLRAMELQVATEVTNAALQVENSLKRYEAATAARSLAQTRLEAEQSRFDVGLSTNFFVVQAQRDLATAQNTELRALLDYRRALVDFQRVQEAPANRGGGITTVQAQGGN